MNETDTQRKQMLRATLPFVLTAASLHGVQRIALLGSLTTTKVSPQDVDLLLSVDETMDLAHLATLGRKLQGRITALTHCNVGADLFLANAQHQYLGRLCHRKSCPCYCRVCRANHCGRRQYLCDDLPIIELPRTLLLAPPLDVWPTIITRRTLPADIEQYLLRPLIDELGLERREQMIPYSALNQIVGRSGEIDLGILAALQEAATFLQELLNEETACHLIEIRPVERYAPTLHFPEIPLRITRLWVVEIDDKSCFVLQGIQEGSLVYLAR
jgi:predicted nucleotidyltransferase